MPVSSTVSPTPNVRVPAQSSRPGVRTPSSFSDRRLHTVPSKPIGTPTQKIACQCHSDSTPPISRPRNDPATAATMLTPSAMPRWLDGKASVRIADDDAISIAPPTPCTTRQPISHSAPSSEVERVERQRDGRDGEHGEAEVVDPHPAEHVAEPAERDHQHRGDHQVAHQHPQQVADVAGGQRVQADAAEDRRQRDQHDRGVDRRQQRAQRGVRQRDPLVVRMVVVHPPTPPGGLGDSPFGLSPRWAVSSSRSQSSSVRSRHALSPKTHILAIQTIGANSGPALPVGVRGA